jgi:hypothetical protein
LAQAQLFRRQGDASAPQQSFQGRRQLEIEAIYMRFLHALDIIHAFYE